MGNSLTDGVREVSLKLSHSSSILIGGGRLPREVDGWSRDSR